MRAALALTVLLGLGALTAEAAEGGAEFVVNSSPITETIRPDASMSDRSGEALVVWSDGFDIRARRFGRAGNPLEDDFQVAETTREYLGPLSGTADPLGFSVVWTESTNRFPGNSFLRRFGRDAEPLAQRGFDAVAANVDSDRRGDSVMVAVNPLLRSGRLAFLRRGTSDRPAVPGRGARLLSPGDGGRPGKLRRPLVQ